MDTSPPQRVRSSLDRLQRLSERMDCYTRKNAPPPSQQLIAEWQRILTHAVTDLSMCTSSIDDDDGPHSLTLHNRE